MPPERYELRDSGRAEHFPVIHSDPGAAFLVGGASIARAVQLYTPAQRWGDPILDRLPELGSSVASKVPVVCLEVISQMPEQDQDTG
jgi:hypothetical protein